jgi:hypothetical protein
MSYLLGGVPGVGNQQAVDRDAELLAEPPARQIEQLLRDGPGFGGLHQAQDFFVVVALALEEDVPHAAGGADEDQPLRLEIVGERQTEVGDACARSRR